MQSSAFLVANLQGYTTRSITLLPENNIVYDLYASKNSTKNKRNLTLGIYNSEPSHYLTMDLNLSDPSRIGLVVEFNQKM